MKNGKSHGKWGIPSCLITCDWNQQGFCNAKGYGWYEFLWNATISQKYLKIYEFPLNLICLFRFYACFSRNSKMKSRKSKIFLLTNSTKTWRWLYGCPMSDCPWPCNFPRKVGLFLPNSCLSARGDENGGDVYDPLCQCYNFRFAPSNRTSEHCTPQPTLLLVYVCNATPVIV